MDWIDLEFFSSDKFKKINKFLKEEAKNGKTIFPDRKNILNALVLTPLDEVKVVILGQDPYYTPNMAQGLAFSVPDDIPDTKRPPSLKNIFIEVTQDIDLGHQYKHTSDLTRWATQGVLLLNTALTVEQGRPNSHNNIGWGLLVREVILSINERKENVVFILWGRNAQIFEMYVNKDKHHVIKSAHPSPFSANKGFFGSKPFSKTNEYLIEHNIEPINW